MNTTINTTNTARKSYDLAAIMRRAWGIRKAAALEMGCKVSEVLWGECIRMAWAEAEASPENAAINAEKTAQEWAAIPDLEKVKFLKIMIRKAAKGNIAYSTEDHYIQYSEVPAFGWAGSTDYDEMVSESWIRVTENIKPENLIPRNVRRAGEYKRPITLKSLVYNAAKAAIAKKAYENRKHSVASSWDVTNDNGEAESYLETRCGDSHKNTEASATLKTILQDFVASRDAIDRLIIAHVAQGYTERETAAALGEAGHAMSNVAVHKRIVKIREGLRALGVAA